MSHDTIPGVEVRAIADPIRLLDDLEGVEKLDVVECLPLGSSPGIDRLARKAGG